MMGLFDVPKTLGSVGSSWDHIPAGYSPNPNRGYAAAMASADEQAMLRTNWPERWNQGYASGYPGSSQSEAQATTWAAKSGYGQRTRSCGPAVEDRSTPFSKPPKPSRDKSSNASRRSLSGNSPNASTPRDRSLVATRVGSQSKAQAIDDGSGYGPSRRSTLGPIATTPYQLADLTSQSEAQASESPLEAGSSNRASSRCSQSKAQAAPLLALGGYATLPALQGQAADSGYGAQGSQSEARATPVTVGSAIAAGPAQATGANSTLSEGGNYGHFSADSVAVSSVTAAGPSQAAGAIPTTSEGGNYGVFFRSFWRKRCQ